MLLYYIIGVVLSFILMSTVFVLDKSAPKNIKEITSKDIPLLIMFVIGLLCGPATIAIVILFGIGYGYLKLLLYIKNKFNNDGEK